MNRMTLAALATTLLAVCRYDGAERKESHEFRSLRAALSNPLVRLRLLNAANARNFDLRFADGRTFHVIASDGGYLSAPIGITGAVKLAQQRRCFLSRSCFLSAPKIAEKSGARFPSKNALDEYSRLT